MVKNAPFSGFETTFKLEPGCFFLFFFFFHFGLGESSQTPIFVVLRGFEALRSAVCFFFFPVFCPVRFFHFFARPCLTFCPFAT